MTLEDRVAALEAAVQKLGEVVVADVESLRTTDAEVARQAHLAPRTGWSRSLNGQR
jgi:hypothetical protein